MASKQQMKKHYINALKKASYYHASGKDSYEKLRKEWESYRKSYYERTGKRAPSVYEMSRTYVEGVTNETPSKGGASGVYVPTIDFGREVIEDFVSQLQRIHQDTFEFIENNKEGGHEKGKLASIAAYKINEIDRIYYECLDTLRRLIQEYGTTIVGQSIKDTVELDYTIAISLYPPSDVVVEFEETLSQLLALESQMAQRASELAQQAEDEYYGK